LRALLQSAGADLVAAEIVFYNDRAGGLFVRAPRRIWDTIESLLQVIGRQPAHGEHQGGVRGDSVWKSATEGTG